MATRYCPRSASTSFPSPQRRPGTRVWPSGKAPAFPRLSSTLLIWCCNSFPRRLCPRYSGKYGGFAAIKEKKNPSTVWMVQLKDSSASRQTSYLVNKTLVSGSLPLHRKEDLRLPLLRRQLVKAGFPVDLKGTAGDLVAFGLDPGHHFAVGIRQGRIRPLMYGHRT